MMRRAHRAARDLAHHLGNPLFMRRVARRELRRDSIARDLFAMILEPPRKRRLIKRLCLITSMIMPPLKEQNRIARKRLGKAMTFKITLGKPDKDKRHAPALPFDKRIRGKRRRKRRQGDIAGGYICLCQDRRHCLADPLGKIMTRRKRLGRGKHLALVLDQNRIRIGAAGINTECYRHSPCLPVRTDHLLRNVALVLPVCDICEPFFRPRRRIRDRLIRVLLQPPHLIKECRITAIAHGIEHIAHKAVAANALDRTAREERPKSSIVKRRQLRQTRRNKLVTRVIAHLARLNREFVPRTSRKAVITAIDTVSEEWAQLMIHRPMMLNRQIRDTAPCVDLVRRGKGIRRTGIKTGPARPTMVDFRIIRV